MAAGRSSRHALAQRRIRSRDDPGALAEVEQRRAEGRILEELDRQAALADEELRCGDVDRPRRLEAADGVDAPGCEVAEGERERAHHAHAVGDAAHSRRRGGDRVGRRALEREDLDPVLRARDVERRAAEEGASAALGDPLLARPEVVDVAEVDVVHRRSLGDREGEREERDRALCVDRPVDRVDDDPQLATAPEGTDAELL